MIELEAASVYSAGEETSRDPGVVSGMFTYEIELLQIFYPWREVGDKVERWRRRAIT